MEKVICNILPALVFCLTIVGSASARIVTVEVTGVVTEVETEGGFALDGSVNVGSIMTGSCTYDTDAPDQDPSGHHGIYPVISLSMSIGNYTFMHNPVSLDPALFDVWKGDMGYKARSLYGIAILNGITQPYNGIYIKVLDLCNASVNGPDDALPVSFPDVSFFDHRNEIEASFSDSGIGFVISGELTSIAAVLEPLTYATYYVDADAPAGGDGGSWDTAFNYLQDALAVALESDEIWIAEGTYKPDEDINSPKGTGDREATFQLINGVAVRGGYAGYGEPDPNARDIELCETILSGDLADDDIQVAEPCDLLSEPTRAENSYHVVTSSGSGNDTMTVLDGVTVASGNANGSYPDYSGGGICCWWDSSLTIIACQISDNSAVCGGGIYNEGYSLTVTDCTISGNFAEETGGGILCYGNFKSFERTIAGDLSKKSEGGDEISSWWDDISATITDCTISNNTAGSGGGIYNGGDGLTVADCTISGNLAEETGGGIYCYGDSNITNCTIADNSLNGDFGFGGGIYYSGEGSTHIITDSTITDNSCDFGAGIFIDDWVYATVTGCTISNNKANRGGGGIFSRSNINSTVNYCTINNNSANSGGGMMCIDSSATVRSCVISGNSAINGGGIYSEIYEGSDKFTITNCTVIGNKTSGYEFEPGVTLGGGGGIYCNWASSPTITNCIFRQNRAPNGQQMYLDNESNVLTSYSDIRNGEDDVYIEPGCTFVWGVGNIDVDPCFVDAGYWDANGTPSDANDDFWVDGDYHLKSEGWSWDTERGVWTWDDVTSRCIDAGNPGSPLGEELLTIPSDPDNEWGENLRINMGAYGGTAEASMGPYNWALLADLTNDDKVDFADLGEQTQDWINSGDAQPGDLNRDGTVDMADFALFGLDWLKQTSWYEP